MSIFTAFEAEVFGFVNSVVEPVVRAGFGSPGIAPMGLIILEHVGRRSGRSYRAPLVGTVVDGHVLVGTLRGVRSEWLRNLSATPQAGYWLGGRLRAALALTFVDGEPAPALDGLPSAVRCMAEALLPGVGTLGWAFAILAPIEQQPG
jgi:deazaflavin-dependent oxidoreductase (nitroreductase family)